MFGSGGVGWLLGPFVGNAVFGVRYRGLRGEIERVSLGGFPLFVMHDLSCLVELQGSFFFWNWVLIYLVATERKGLVRTNQET